MTERELSEKLDNLATRLDLASLDGGNYQEIRSVAEELRKLSNEKYSPGSTDWNAVRKASSPAKKTYKQQGKRTPF